MRQYKGRIYKLKHYYGIGQILKSNQTTDYSLALDFAKLFIKDSNKFNCAKWLKFVGFNEDEIELNLQFLLISALMGEF